MIFLIDLDGTLLDSDHLHYQAWARVLNLSHEYIERVITTHGIQYILDDYPDPHYLRKQKINQMLKFEDIKLMNNAESFINFIVENNINHVVVTNTDRKVVRHFREKLPILNKLKNWIVREDYEKPKPDPECYKLALNLFQEDNEPIIGFENSNEGVQALANVTHNIFYIFPETDYLKVLEHVKTQCPKRFGTHPINLNPTVRRKLKRSRLAFVMVGSLALVTALLNLRGGWQTSSERNMDSL
jgi:beta-phosphoglucomutase